MRRCKLRLSGLLPKGPCSCVLTFSEQAFSAEGVHVWAFKKLLQPLKRERRCFPITSCRHEPSCRSDSVGSKPESALRDWFADAAGGPCAGPLATASPLSSPASNLTSLRFRAPARLDCSPDGCGKLRGIKLQLRAPADTVGCFK